MKKEGNKLIITRIELDHVLDIDLFEEEKNIPPSELFIEGLKKEMMLNGIKEKELDNIVTIEINLLP